MDKNAIGIAIHEIKQMVLVAIVAAETASDTDPSTFACRSRIRICSLSASLIFRSGLPSSRTFRGQRMRLIRIMLAHVCLRVGIWLAMLGQLLIDL